jgi:organic radical activating enzyme
MYKVVETFRSIQSEGFHAGTPALFIRLFGCNLDCKFGLWKCDEPLHKEVDTVTQYSIYELLELAEASEMKHIVITGGEPSMHDLTKLISKLRKQGHYVQIETNGLNLSNIHNANYITYSPKMTWADNAPELKSGFHELKLLASPEYVPNIDKWALVKRKYIQPIADGDKINIGNVRWCAKWVTNHPTWKLSLQTHKWYGGQ